MMFKRWQWLIVIILGGVFNGALAQEKDLLTDVMRFGLKGSVKSMAIESYLIPVEALEAKEILEEDHRSYLVQTEKAFFNAEGFLERNIIAMMMDQTQMSLTEQIYFPYHHNERPFYLIMLFGDQMYHPDAAMKAVLKKEYSNGVEIWKNRSLKQQMNTMTARELVNTPDRNEYVITTTQYDTKMRIISSEVAAFSEVHRSDYIYVTFTEYQEQDLLKEILEETIYVTATREEIGRFTAQDFQKLPPHVVINVKEDFDEMGNPRVEWDYNHQSGYKKVMAYTYY